MTGALTRYWENQYAGVVGDFQRKAAYIAKQAKETSLQKEWLKLGDMGQAKFADYTAYRDDHPEIKDEKDWEKLLAELGKPEVLALLLPYAKYEIYRNRIQDIARSTLNAIATKLREDRVHLKDDEQKALDSVTKMDYQKDFDMVIAEVEDLAAQVGKDK